MIYFSNHRNLAFMIVQSRVCPAFMVPVAEFDPGAVCVHLTPKVGPLNPGGTISVTLKGPVPNITTRVCPSPRVNEDG